MTQWLVAQLQKGHGKIEWSIPERPLLHVCCANDIFGGIEEKRAVCRLDIRSEVHPDIIADITKRTTISDDDFAACFADFPWVESWRMNSARAINEMLRIAPVVYTLSPWLLGSSRARITDIKVARRPGINHPLLFIRYVRKLKDLEYAESLVRFVERVGEGRA